MSDKLFPQYEISKYPYDKLLLSGNEDDGTSFAESFVENQSARFSEGTLSRISFDPDGTVSIFAKIFEARNTYSQEDALRAEVNKFFDAVAKKGVSLEGDDDETKVLRAWLEMFYARYKLANKIPRLGRNRFLRGQLPMDFFEDHMSNSERIQAIKSKLLIEAIENSSLLS